MPFSGSAWATTAGNEHPLALENVAWYDGRAKKRLVPNPPAPVGGVSAPPFHHVSPLYTPPAPETSEVPPTAVRLGESAGTAIVLALPSRQVLPLSPLPENTLIPDICADWRIVSMPCTSASEVWSSQ